MAAIFAARLLNGRAPLVFEDGRQQRDFVNVADVVAANVLAMERKESDGMALNVGSGRAVSISEIAAVLGKELGVEIPAEITGKYRAGDIRHCLADITRAGQVLGYCPRVRLRRACGNWWRGWPRNLRTTERRRPHSCWTGMG